MSSSYLDTPEDLKQKLSPYLISNEQSLEYPVFRVLVSYGTFTPDATGTLTAA